MGSPLIVALDLPDRDAACRLVDTLDPAECRLKVGKQLFVSAGPDCVREFSDRGFSVFLDLKFHDIPNTVAAAVSAAAELGVWMVNVHAAGGRDMLRAASRAADEAQVRPLLTAVTVLTSLDDDAVGDVYPGETTNALVARLAALALDSGCDGLVCAPTDLAELRSRFGAGPVLVTPGIRPQGTARDDQVRVATPASAMDAGSSYIVVGRPVTCAEDPRAAVQAINASLGFAVAGTVES